MRRAVLLSMLFAPVIVAQQPRQAIVGTDAPPILAEPLDTGHPFPGWQAYRGDYVVIDFWATWCGPCLPALAHVAAMEKEFKGQPIRFVTVAHDTPERVSKYLTEKHIALETYVESDTGLTQTSYGIHTIPGAAIIDRHGHVLAVTSGENVTSAVLKKLLAGEEVHVPPYLRENNLTWDQEEIAWQDGVQPTFEVLFKPMEVSGAGYMHQPGSNRISGDGMSASSMIMAAWDTDIYHLEIRNPISERTYRFAVQVPKGNEADLLPTFQDALQRNFSFQAHWEERERDVLVLHSDGSQSLAESTSAPMLTFHRGEITLKKQSTKQLAKVLPNWTRTIVVDETGLGGAYDFDLKYRGDDSKTLTDILQRNYGLVLTPGKRTVRVLVVDKRNVNAG